MTEKAPSFASNVIKITGSNVFAQGLGLSVIPIVTRLFLPEAFGVASIFVSITAIFSVLACCRYELSIMLPRTDEEAANMFGVSLFSVLLITGISSVILFFPNLTLHIFKSSSLIRYLWMVPIAVLIAGISLALNSWSSRKKQFGRISVAKAGSSIVTQTTKLAGGFSGYATGGILIGSTIMGTFFDALLLGAQIWKDDYRLFKKNIRPHRMFLGAKRYKDFLIFSTWTTLFNTASLQVPSWVLAYYFSPVIVGYFALAKAIAIPLNIIGTAISQVFYQRAVETHYGSGSLAKLVEEIFSRLAALTFLPFLVMALIGKEIFVVVFGSHWVESGIYAQILSVWLLFSFISTPLNSLFNVLEKQREGLFLSIILFATRAISLIIGGMIGNPRIAIAIFSCTGAIACLWLSYWILSHAGVSLRRSYTGLSKSFFFSLPFLGITLVTKLLFDSHPFLITLVGGLIPSMLYFFFIFKKDHVLQSHVYGMFSRFLTIKNKP